MTTYTKIILLSDLHLRAGGADAIGLDTTTALRTAVTQINDWHPDADFIAFLGDITDDGADDTYRGFAEIAEGLTAPWRLTLGNHDRAAGAATIVAPNPETGRHDHDIPLGPGRLVLLDTSVDGASHGALSDVQLDWLGRRDLTKPTLVGLHHPPNPLGIWTDRIRLQDDAGLADALSAATGPVQILAGHVHMPSSGVWRGFPVATLAGGHFRVLPVLETVPRDIGQKRNFCTGPLEYAIALISQSGVQLHFEAYGPPSHGFTDAQIALLLGHD